METWTLPVWIRTYIAGDLGATKFTNEENLGSKARYQNDKPTGTENSLELPMSQGGPLRNTRINTLELPYLHTCNTRVNILRLLGLHRYKVYSVLAWLVEVAEPACIPVRLAGFTKYEKPELLQCHDTGSHCRLMLYWGSPGVWRSCPCLGILYFVLDPISSARLGGFWQERASRASIHTHIHHCNPLWKG